jgi:hypothetical protein
LVRAGKDRACGAAGRVEAGQTCDMKRTSREYRRSAQT